MLDEDKLREPYFRGLLCLPFGDLTQPFFVNNQHGIDRPCELAIRGLEMPLIDSLAEDTRYRIGVAMRYVARTLDDEGLTVARAIDIYGALAERIGDWMDQHSQNTAAFNIDTLLDLYVSERNDLLADFVSWLRERTHAYVSGKIASIPQRAPSLRAFDIEATCAELLSRAPVLHVQSHVFDQCERADWTPDPAHSHVLPVPFLAFRVQVDGETWPQSESDPFIRLQTEWLLIDVREPQWKC